MFRGKRRRRRRVKSITWLVEERKNSSTRAASIVPASLEVVWFLQSKMCTRLSVVFKSLYLVNNHNYYLEKTTT
jgi:hypothetical protein